MKAPTASERPMASVRAAVTMQIVRARRIEISSLPVLSDAVKNARDDLPCHNDNGDQQENSLADFPEDLAVLGAAWRTEAREQNGENDDGKIFDQSEGDHDAAVLGTKFAAIDEKAHEHHSAGHGDYAADGDTLSKRPTKQPAGAHAQANGEKIPMGAPISATHFTWSSSGMENSMPMENISRMTPTSAMVSKV